MNYLYVFMDVSGNYDFSPTGTKYLVLTSVLCHDVSPGILELYSLKHDVIGKGVDLEYFHASEDRQAVRDDVFDIIADLGHLRVDSIIVDKSKAHPSLRPLDRFYPRMVENLLKYPFDPRGVDIGSFDTVLIFADREASRSAERKAMVKGMKTSLSRHLRGVPYQICMHRSSSHLYLQVADYCSWAIYVKWERSELRPYDRIRGLVESEFHIFQRGEVTWY